jgi:dTDP-4-dehydrorhamnose reductase
MTKILVTGKNGQLGSELQAVGLAYPQYQFVFTDREELDIADKKQVQIFLKETSFDYIVNCAAYTAVDKAEADYATADQINAKALEYIAQEIAESKTTLIHISTDYVFNGNGCKPYIETDRTDPQSAYGKSKLGGEEKSMKYHEGTFVIRTSWVYSSFGNNFVKTMLKLGAEKDKINVVYDQVGAPTYAKDLAKAILTMIYKIETDNLFYQPGIYHYSNEGVTSWYDFALEIMQMSGLKCKVSPILSIDYPTPAKRPHYSLMHKKKIKDNFGIEIPHWKESLKSCLQELKQYK